MGLKIWILIWEFRYNSLLVRKRANSVLSLFHYHRLKCSLQQYKHKNKDLAALSERSLNFSSIFAHILAKILSQLLLYLSQLFSCASNLHLK